MSDTTKASRLMHFPLAYRYAMQGYAIRRSLWNGTTKPLAWVTYSGGLYFITTAAAPATESPDELSPYVVGTGPYTRVVEATDVTAEDLRARDWTLLAPGCITADESDDECGCASDGTGSTVPGYDDGGEDFTPAAFDMSAPNAHLGLNGCNLPGGACACAPTTGSTSGSSGTGGTEDAPAGMPAPGDSPGAGSVGGGGGFGAGGSGGGAGGSGGSSGGSGARDGGGSFAGGGGGAGGNSSKPSKRRPTPKRAAPAVTLTLTRINDECVHASMASTSNQWTANVELAEDDNARPGEVWFVNVRSKNNTVVYNGTIAPGDTVGIPAFSVSGPPGSTFKVWATCYLPKLGIQNVGQDAATFPSSCPACPIGEHWDEVLEECVVDGGGPGGGGEECASGYHWDGEACIPNCMDGYVWNPAAGECQSVCPVGYSWDGVSSVCVPNCSEGYAWDAESSTCIAVCGPGYHWDGETMTCVLDA